MRVFAALGLAAGLMAQPGPYGFDHAQKFLRQYCEKCHQDQAPAGGFRLSRVAKPESLGTDAAKWTSLVNRVKNGEMPPKGAPAPPIEERESLGDWVQAALRKEACAAGIVPGKSLIRRLNRDEYAATVRDLLDMHMDIARSLPADGAGGEGFDNAAETLFLSPLHSEKYLETAKFAVGYAAKEYKSQERLFVVRPGAGVTEEQAARRILKEFLPRAFRRPLAAGEEEPYLTLFQSARKQPGETFESAVWFAVRGALASPYFLFRAEPPNPGGAPRLLDQYSMASRLSYFLWGSMPDELLFDLAAKGKLHDPEVLRQLVPIMLRNDRSMGFAQSFTEQWLHTRELSGDKAPDAKLFPDFTKDEDLRSDIRYQPIMFFREVFLRNMPLDYFLDSKHTIGTRKLERHFGLKLPLNANQTSQPHWVSLPENTNRGGLLGMPAVLAVSSYPYRTSPVLRGAWILEAMLGTPPPPPPPNVPALEEHKGDAPKTVRERLDQHRTNPVCNSCHSRIDPFGFALENYDVTGKWRDQDSGRPIDARGELIDGTKFDGPAELRKVLLDRKDLFVRHLTNKVLGYALGRGLTLKDACTVDAIVAKVKQNNHSARTLIEEIVLSVPFRYQAGNPPVKEPTAK